MSPALILGCIVLAPPVVLMVLRVNAALVFLSLCLGSVLTRFLGPDANGLLTLFSAHSPKAISASQSTAQLTLLLIPVVITVIFMVKTVPAGLKLVLNVLPAAGVGLLAALLVVPLLPYGTGHAIMMTDLWRQAERAQDLIVGISAMLCLVALLGLRPKSGSDGKHGKKHKA